MLVLDVLKQGLALSSYRQRSGEQASAARAAGEAFPRLVGGGRSGYAEVPYSGVRKPGRDDVAEAACLRGNPMARDLEQPKI